MKVKETIERDCCQPRDLFIMPNQPGPAQHGYYFCRHCGRHWEDERYMDPAGSMDTRQVALPWPWETPPKRETTWKTIEEYCMATFGGGHRDSSLEIFQHGMSTVFNYLRASCKEAWECLK